MHKIVWIAIASAASLLAAIAVWTLRSGAPASPPSVAAGPAADARPPASASELAELRRLLDEEHEARIELTQEVSELRRQVAALPGSAGESEPASEAREPAAPSPGPGSSALQADPGAAAPPGPAGFDPAALASLDLAERDVDRLREAWEKKEMDLLYLRDQARREGWARKPRFAHQAELLEQGLRRELGDRDYYRALYAAGRPNRVQVQWVLNGSPAQAAGLRAGDRLLRVNGRTVFSPQEVPRALGEAAAGSTTELGVMGEDGTVRKVTLPTGPLGVQLGASSALPSD